MRDYSIRVESIEAHDTNTTLDLKGRLATKPISMEVFGAKGIVQSSVISDHLH